MNQTTYTLLENYMLSCMGDSAHDKDHIYRVLYNAMKIAKVEENAEVENWLVRFWVKIIGGLQSK